MSDNVIPLTVFTNGRVVGEQDVEAVARQFERIAADIRAGETSILRGLIVYQDPCGMICRIPVGNAMCTMTAMGMLEWAKAQLSPDPEIGD